MSLVNLSDLLHHAQQGGYAIPCLRISDNELLDAALSAAEALNAPLILCLDPVDRSARLRLPGVVAAAREASGPIAILGMDCVTVDNGSRAVQLGCNGLHHYFGSDEEASQRLDALLDVAVACGLELLVRFAEPGTDADDGSLIQRARQLGIDLLALDPDQLARLTPGEPQGIPMILQQADALSDAEITQAMRQGVCGVEFESRLQQAADAAVRTSGDDREDPGGGDPATQTGWQQLTQAVRSAVQLAVADCIRACAAVDEAAGALAACAAWREVDHVILFNTRNDDLQETQQMMAEGRRILSAIPGVRRVVTGVATREDAPYHYAWLVRFCHPEVIQSYRDHPDHVDFADRGFRPIAQDRISIDFQASEWQPDDR